MPRRPYGFYRLLRWHATGLGTIRLVFLSLLAMSMVVMVTKVNYVLNIPTPYPVPPVPELAMPNIIKGWDAEFERSAGNKWIVAVGKTGNTKMEQQGYTIVYVPERNAKVDNRTCRPPRCVYLHSEDDTASIGVPLRYLSSSSYTRRLIGYLYAISRDADVIYTRHIYNYKPEEHVCQILPHNAYSIIDMTLDKGAIEDLRSINFNTTLASTMPWYVYHKYVLRHQRCYRAPTVPPYMTPPKPIARRVPLSISLETHGGDRHDDSGITSELGGRHDASGISPEQGGRHNASGISPKQGGRHNASGIPPRSNAKDSHPFTVLHSSISSFKYETFWGLLFSTYYGALGHMVIQRLLKEIAEFKSLPLGLSDILFFDAPWKNEENPINRTYTPARLKTLQKQLDSWICADNRMFVDCLHDLMVYLRGENIFKDEDVNLVNSWIKSLMAVEYQMPTRIHVLRTNHAHGDSNLPKPDKTSLSKYCPNRSVKRNEPIITDIGLLIAFNDNLHYSNIQLLEDIYRPYFKHIVYCGPDIHSFTRESTIDPEVFYSVFIEAYKKDWFFFYDCLMLALQLNIDVEGFIQIGDDTLLNPWNLRHLPRNSFWLHKGLDILNVSLQTLQPDWQWWNHEFGKPAVLRVFEEMKSVVSSEGQNDIVRSFLNIYNSNSKNMSYIYRQGCDFMFVPRVFADVYLKIGSMFHHHEVLTELAHATIVMGLQHLKDIVFVEDGSLWAVWEKDQAWYYFNENKLFLHPFKVSLIERNDNLKFVFCNKYMPLSEKYLT